MTTLPVLLLLTGCSPKAADDGSASADDTGASAAPDCGDFEGVVMTAEQVLATPRPNERAEGTVLCARGGPVATDEALYERVVADFRTILDTIGDYERSSGFYDMPSFDWDTEFPRELIFEVDDDTLSRVEAGTYHEWDCLNAWYEVTPPTTDLDHYLVLEFDGLYDAHYLVDEYAALAGASAVWAEEYPSDYSGYQAQVSVIEDGDTLYYGYWAMGGDCPEGCTEYLGLYFVSTAAGEVELAGAYVRSESERSDTTPGWAAFLPDCAG